MGENIVIAWSRRQDQKSFIEGLREADCKQEETRHWIAVAHDCGYIPNELAWTILGRCFNLGKGIKAFIPEEFGILKDEKYSEVDIDLIKPNPDQPRVDFRDAAIAEWGFVRTIW